jgi:protein arginine N-methyltransferase 7
MSFVPPGHAVNAPLFGKVDEVQAHYLHIPPRLRQRQAALIDVANDFHFAMLNDKPRNAFYADALVRAIVPGESIVLDIGSGSGLLAILAAKAGAKHVYSIEGSRDMAEIARTNVLHNGLQSRVTILHRLSTDVQSQDLQMHGRPTVLVSELLGTLLLGEDALAYVADARTRLMSSASSCIVIPEQGIQYVTLIESEAVRNVSYVGRADGSIDMDAFNLLRDTSSTFLTKQVGFRLSKEGYRAMSIRMPVFSVNFATDDRAPSRPRHTLRLPFVVSWTGVIDAAMFSWSVSAPGADAVMSTHPEETVDNLPRDMHWGQALQKLADTTSSSDLFHCTEGESLVLVLYFSSESPTMHAHLERA